MVPQRKLSLRERWREWNRRHSLAMYESSFGEDEDAISGFAKHPYACWYVYLIPIAGLVFFYGVVWEENLARRRRELNERIKARERWERMLR
jgi:hypothetical protein